MTTKVLQELEKGDLNLELQGFCPEYLPFPYNSTSESVQNTAKWLQKEKTRSNPRPVIVYAALMYSTSVLSYLRNRDFYAMEAIFMEDLVENPLKVLQVFADKLGLDDTNLEDTLIPFHPKVSKIYIRNNRCHKCIRFFHSIYKCRRALKL